MSEPTNPAPPPAVASNPPASGVDDLQKMERLLAAFKMERQAYLFCNFAGVILLFGIAALQVYAAFGAQDYAQMGVIVAAMFGSGGIVMFATSHGSRDFPSTSRSKGWMTPRSSKR
jgi:hypothetical protein